MNQKICLTLNLDLNTIFVFELHNQTQAVLKSLIDISLGAQ